MGRLLTLHGSRITKILTETEAAGEMRKDLPPY
jgi:hypothetical protein